MATTPENAVKARIKGWLKDQQIFYWSNAAGPYSVHGIPDLMAIKDGVLSGIEVNRPGGRATPHQLRFIAAIQAAGGKAAVCDTLDAVLELFDVSPTQQTSGRAKATKPK
jgi:hypothetical protein